MKQIHLPTIDAINEITEGDVLAFKNAGAYCFMMASNYNSRYRPAEVLWYNETAHLIRKREVFEDLTKESNFDRLLDVSTLYTKINY